MNSNDAQSPSQKRLQDKVAIITGGARGIGAATATLFAQNGAHVIIADILDELGTNLANSIGGCYMHCDVSKEDNVASTVELALKWKGRLDIMFNNAGIADSEKSIANLNMGNIQRSMSVNVFGCLHGIKHAARAMIKSQTGGSIICTSSTAGVMGGLASHAYTLSKGAIIALVKSCACELGVHGIRVNCISPHGVPSEMLVSSFRSFLGKMDVEREDVRKVVGEATLLKGRCASENDIANATLFLASEEARFVTSHNLVVDGGFTSAYSNMSFIYEEKTRKSLMI